MAANRGIAVLTTTASYQMIVRDLPRSLDRTAAAPLVQRSSAYYLENIGKVRSIDDFLANDRLFSFAMKAFGLEDMTYAKAFMRKALEGGIDARDSFANSLTDRRYRDFVATFNFVRYGEATTAFDKAQQGTVDRYIRQTLETTAGADNEGVRLALYFERRAPEIENAYSILADPALLKVVQVALGLPPESGALDIDRQAALIKSRIPLDDFDDPAKVRSFLARFTSLWELQRQTAASAPALQLIAPPTSTGIGAGILATLQNLKLGGI